MKKEYNKKWILPLFILGLIAVNIILVSAFSFKTDIIDKFFVPEGYTDKYGVAILAAIIGIILIFVIIGDLLSLVSPLSDWVNWMIAGGVSILIISLGWARTVVSYMIGVVSGIFGIGASFALIMTSIVFVILIFFLFFGGLQLQKWITEIKGRRQILDAQKKAYKSAARIIKGARTLEEAGSGI